MKYSPEVSENYPEIYPENYKMMGEKMLSLGQGDRGMEAGIFFVGWKIVMLKEQGKDTPGLARQLPCPYPYHTT